MNHMEGIRQALKARGLDGLLITDEKNQRYAAGFPFTDGAVLVGLREAWLITDSRYIEAAAQQAQGVELLLYGREQPLTALLKSCIDKAGIRRLAAEEEKLSHRDWQWYEKALGVELLPSAGLFAELRAVKSQEEITCLRRAQSIAEQALEQVLPLVRPGAAERELAAELVFRMRRLGAEGESFPPIVVSGVRGSLPHGEPGDKLIERGDFVTMDFGCVKDGYCSDMTRTVAVGGATEEMRNVYALVLKAQLAGIAAARAGVPGRDIDAAARGVIGEAGFGEYFGHGFGHGLGLDIHEPPNANPGGLAPMPEGAVCSAEPGIYLPGRFGVRIEDVMILRASGAELITKASKELLILGS